MNSSEKIYLKKVILDSDVYAACLQHALTTEKEEVMGLLIGEVDEESCISHISACVVLHRSDKQPDRVEISPEQLCEGSVYAEELARQLKKPMRVLGWYHSHPHITVWPSHVDVRTQLMYQTMDPFFVGLIFAVYQNNPGSIGNMIQLTCFQGHQQGSEFQRREVELVVENTPFKKYNLESIAKLTQILSQEVQNEETENNSKQDVLACLRNDALKTVALVDIVSKVTMPLCEALEARLEATKARVVELEKLKEILLNEQQ